MEKVKHMEKEDLNRMLIPATERGNNETVEMLIKHEADVWAKSYHGYAAYWYAKGRAVVSY